MIDVSLLAFSRRSKPFSQPGFKGGDVRCEQLLLMLLFVGGAGGQTDQRWRLGVQLRGPSMFLFSYIKICPRVLDSQGALGQVSGGVF